MIREKREISRSTVRNANSKLVSRSAKTGRFISDNSKNGSIIFTASYFGKNYRVNITKSQIKTAFKESLGKTTSKK